MKRRAKKVPAHAVIMGDLKEVLGSVGRGNTGEKVLRAIQAEILLSVLMRMHIPSKELRDITSTLRQLGCNAHIIRRVREGNT